MTLSLNGLEVLCIIGERPDERVRPQRLMVDVSLDVSPRAAETDALCDTVDYAALAERIRAALVAAKCRMIERAAKVVHDVCSVEAGVASGSVRVKVTKAGAIRGLASASVCYP